MKNGAGSFSLMKGSFWLTDSPHAPAKHACLSRNTARSVCHALLSLKIPSCRSSSADCTDNSQTSHRDSLQASNRMNLEIIHGESCASNMATTLTAMIAG